ncbi:hypothetical protein ZWY2020_050627 [Hordeum vulgare]|nr:hypothetical protein ZWY2020_050627 [Hordeum vulgare]
MAMHIDHLLLVTLARTRRPIYPQPCKLRLVRRAVARARASGGRCFPETVTPPAEQADARRPHLCPSRSLKSAAENLQPDRAETQRRPPRAAAVCFSPEKKLGTSTCYHSALLPFFSLAVRVAVLLWFGLFIHGYGRVDIFYRSIE